MTYLIKLILICYILTLSKINAQDNNILNNKIIFKINNNVYTSVDLKNRKNYLELLKTIFDLGLVDNVASVQLSIRLLIPLASNLLELDEIKESTHCFNDKALSYNWHYNDPNMDTLENNIRLIVEEGESQKKTRREILLRLWEAATKFKKSSDNYPDKINFSHKDSNIPTMSESWYCCAEPSPLQVAKI